ncbi:hypothetical protein GCE9029_05105 [Grimontia celer]|uniref:Uncharacterized protein n=1 Tax=Grimontia celer TaxID=1796497 RepID=A0A128FFW5_9GAMM|nr:hypothetical protein GCE9029_05105 [Grimontia celer]
MITSEYLLCGGTGHIGAELVAQGQMHKSRAIHPAFAHTSPRIGSTAPVLVLAVTLLGNDGFAAVAQVASVDADAMIGNATASR